MASKDPVTFSVTVEDLQAHQVTIEIEGVLASIDAEGLKIEDEAGLVCIVPLPYLTRVSLPS